MARRRGKPVNGWLVLDKPHAMTSTHVLNRIKRLFDAAKAGHAGTLDPLATGVLPIAFGEATKTIPYVVDSAKEYRFLVRWGLETTTDDAEGDPVQQSGTRPTREAIEAELPQFRGKIMQTPPRFSAIKIGGERAYDLARDGEDFEIAAREVEITRFDIADIPDADTCLFEVECGKGTYVRSLARDLGRLLGCYGHVAELRRLRVGPFHHENAISLERLTELSNSDGGREALMQVLLPVETALDGIPALAVGGADAARLKRGKPVIIRGRDAPIHHGLIYITSQGKLLALGEMEGGEFQPLRVFNLPL
ncbi:MAG: tRNA pseudouridine(55) synthase TruB [Alphaproteobacteria bacterium]